MDMDIDPGAESFLKSAISDAQSQGTSTFVLILNTNGGNGVNMENMVSAIQSFASSNHTFITFVGPAGQHAFSAGAYIAEASTKIYMTKGTAIGSATPIITGIPSEELNSTLRKDTDAFATYMESLAAFNHRNATAAGLMVTQGVSYTPEQATTLGVINGEINGTSVQQGLSQLGIPASTPIHTIDARSALLSILSDPTIASLLFLVGTFSILVDLYHPTIVLTVVGAVLIALAIYGLGSIGASALAISLMVIAAAFIFVELKTHHGIFASIGVVVFALGFFLVFEAPPPSSPGSPPSGNFYQFGALQIGLVSGLGALVVLGSVFLYRYRTRVLGGQPLVGTSHLIGNIGIVRTRALPGEKGVALVSSEDWSVVSDQKLEPGDKVKVIGADGVVLKVEKVNSA
jgi:membrane-bound serine protease (ClpP class)